MTGASCVRGIDLLDVVCTALVVCDHCADTLETAMFWLRANAKAAGSANLAHFLRELEGKHAHVVSTLPFVRELYRHLKSTL